MWLGGTEPSIARTPSGRFDPESYRLLATERSRGARLTSTTKEGLKEPFKRIKDCTAEILEHTYNNILNIVSVSTVQCVLVTALISESSMNNKFSSFY